MGSGWGWEEGGGVGWGVGGGGRKGVKAPPGGRPVSQIIRIDRRDELI